MNIHVITVEPRQTHEKLCILHMRQIKKGVYQLRGMHGNRAADHRLSFRSLDITISLYPHMSLVMRKPAFCVCKNKDADQLRGDREADQRLCFRYTDSAIPLLPKYEILSL